MIASNAQQAKILFKLLQQRQTNLGRSYKLISEKRNFLYYQIIAPF